jgi:phage N-6-adenine-methyltransferase
MKTGPSVNKGRSKQDYGTPPEFIRAVEERFGPLDLDLACNRENFKAKAGLCYPGVDSLQLDWTVFHGTYWLNPPFENIGAWALKCAAQCRIRHGLTLMLTPASIGTQWFDLYVHRQAVVLALSPRLTFEGTSDPYPKDLMLSVYGYGLTGFDTWRWKL